MNAVQMETQSNRTQTARYMAFCGVDMSSDPTKVQPMRSPYAPNLIADSGGFPEKRVGWRTLLKIEAPVNGLFLASIQKAGEAPKRMYLAHGGTKLYDITDMMHPKVLKEGIHNARSIGFSTCGKFWMLTGREYLVYDGGTVKHVSEIATRPITSIGRNPLGGGQMHDDVNLLSKYRENRFLSDGNSKKYQLDTTDLDADAVKITVNGQSLAEGKDFSVDRKSGIINFTSAPAQPQITGEDNVFVCFSKTIAGAYEKIARCTIAALYGSGGDGFVFLSGNRQYPAQDFHSALRDPAYFPDNGYSLIGSEATAVMGYARMGEYLLVLKESDEENSTIFLRSCRMDSAVDAQIKTTFPLQAGAVGTGMIAPRAVGHMADEPLFVSQSGVYAVTSNRITSERTVENRSYFVDASLCAQKRLSSAVCTEWNGRFLIAVEDIVYVLDGRQAAVRPTDGQKVYECFYWTNIPAVCFLPQGEELFFGTQDGRICKFNTDILSMDRFNDDGAPIVASWSTKADDDGDFMAYKTLLRRGCGVMIKPYARSGCTIRLRTEEDFGKDVRSVKTDIFSFEDLDFSRLVFAVNDAPQVIPFSARVRRYVTIQVIVENSAANEGFGVFGIIRRYRKSKILRR